jgi:hypothetical protein
MTLTRDARHLALPQVGAAEFPQLGISKREDCPICA